MTGSMWLLFIVATVGFGLWELLNDKAKDKPSEQKPFDGERPGKTPHPAGYIVDMPGGAMRLIDLRGLPLDDLEKGNTSVVREQLRLERPVPVQIWVVPIDSLHDAYFTQAWKHPRL